MDPAKPLTAKTVLITAADRPVGTAIATACARAGAGCLILQAGDASELATVGSSVEANGSRAILCSRDFGSPADVARALAELPQVDVLVNGTSTNRPQPFLEVDEETFDLLWEVNVRQTFFVSQAVVRTMIDAGRPGVIINMSSQMGHIGASRRTHYCATKHAVEGLTKAIAVEMAAAGIRVVSIAPTFIRSPINERELGDPQIRAEFLSQIPLGRFAELDDIVGSVVFAASDAAAFLTGSSIKLDGGWTAR